VAAGIDNEHVGHGDLLAASPTECGLRAGSSSAPAMPGNGGAMDLTEYAEALPARLQPFGPVSLRRMFGGYGVFYQGLMVGLVAGDGLYLKTDARSAPLFIEAGCRQFVYYR